MNALRKKQILAIVIRPMSSLIFIAKMFAKVNSFINRPFLCYVPPSIYTVD